ncbi:response regulator transcription factor [Candidatus Acetothermia bacterium]|nr:response regulator transcription factor [Candidatus Acetothermia bacterium]
MKILIAEDDAKVLEMLHTFLLAKNHETFLAADGMEAIEKFNKEKPDMILSDITMPRLDGWELLYYVRAAGQTPVIMITGQDATDDVVKALSAGADDYITKPFKLREVEARIEAVLRRSRATLVLKVGELEIDDKSKSVRLRGKTVKLSPKEYELLKLFASEPGRVFSDEELVRRLWPKGSLASSTDIKRYIYLLRQKIEQDANNPQLIQTITGFGYKLVA